MIANTHKIENIQEKENTPPIIGSKDNNPD